MAYDQYQYEVTFKGKGIGKDDELTVNGSHTFNWTPRAAHFTVDLEKHPVVDGKLKLTISFDEAPPQSASKA